MRIGIGLPNSIPDTPGAVLLEWARRAEAAGFSSLATIDRIAYPSYESLIALAGAAGATTRIGLMTNSLLGPTRDPVLLAKEAASVDQLSNGRLVLGLSVGARQDDFALTGRNFHDRGRRWDEALELIHRAWQGETIGDSPHPITPRPVRDGKIPIMVGGMAPRAIERAIRWGVGWTAGGAPPEAAAQVAASVRNTWTEAGKAGEPRIAALSYYALGPHADEGASTYLGHYYGFAPWGKDMWQMIPRSEEAVRERVRQFEEVGVEELFLDPTIADVEQVDRLAEVVLR